MAQYFYIGPWVWHTALEPGGECWAPPDGTVGSIDLRPRHADGRTTEFEAEFLREA